DREQPAESRKTVTVVACDAAGSPAADPEALRRVQLETYEAAAAVLERHGASVAKFGGDAVIAVFGVPYVREDDALRAVRAAHELVTSEPALPVRVGVGTGEVVVGGHEFVTGEPVRAAKRLAQDAAPGEVLLAEETH